MIVLSMDTAHAACSVCVYDSAAEKALAHACEPMRQGHAERLADMVDETIAAAGLSLKHIDRFAVCSGPGTFTGVRIALSFARGLSLVLKVPVVSITTFQALVEAALPLANGKSAWIVQDARRGEVYLQCFGADGQPLSDAGASPFAEASDLISRDSGCVAGSGAHLLQLSVETEILNIDPIPDAGIIARLAAAVDPADNMPVPFYLRAADAKAQAPLIKHQPGQINIEQAGLSHAAILSEMHYQCFEDPWDEKAMVDLLALSGTTTLLAFEKLGADNHPCGFLMFRKAANETEVFAIAVLPNKRRRSVGRKLMQELVRITGEAGGGSIFIEYADANSAAHELYAGLGFVQTGRRVKYYRNPDGTSHDAITAVLNVSAA
jgi:N6-L-threonylcarbamoyladenine synthase